MPVATGLLELTVPDGAPPSSIPTRWQAWRAGHWRGLLAGLAILGGLYGAFRATFGPPAPPSNFALTVLIEKSPETPHESYRLDGELVYPNWHAALDDGTSASATMRRYRARAHSAFAIVRRIPKRPETSEEEFPLRGFDRECHLILHRRPDRVDVSECLAPIARRQ